MINPFKSKVQRKQVSQIEAVKQKSLPLEKTLACYFIEAFSWLDEAYPHDGGQSALLTLFNLNIKLIQ